MTWWDGKPPELGEFKHCFRMEQFFLERIAEQKNWELVQVQRDLMVCDPWRMGVVRYERRLPVFRIVDCHIGTFSRTIGLFYTNMLPQFKDNRIEPFCNCCRRHD